MTSDADFRRGLEALDEALGALNDLEHSKYVIEDGAKAHQLAAELLIHLGDIDGALDRLQTAEDLFKAAGAAGRDYARFLHDFAVLWIELSIPRLALDYARRSAEAFDRTAVSKHKKAEAWAFVEALELDVAETADNLEVLRSGLRSARRGDRAEAAQRLMVSLLRLGPAGADVRELHAAFKIAVEATSQERSAHQLDRHSTVLQSALPMWQLGFSIPDWTSAFAEAAIAAAESTGRLDLEADFSMVLAACAFDSGDYGSALDVALRAVARQDEFVLRTETSMTRLLVTRQNAWARQIAIESAIKLDKPQVSAELIEAARLQVAPETAGSGRRAESAIGRLHAVTVEGASALATHYNAQLAPDELPIESMIHGCGGAAAVWWGTWASNGSLYWAVRTSKGEWHSGATALNAEGSTTSEFFATFEQGFIDEGPLRDVLLGPWCSPEAEERLAQDVGEWLVPAPLKLILQDAWAVRDTVSLVTSGNLLSLYPPALLAVRSASDASPFRVIEAATVRVAPPTVLTAHAAIDAPPTPSEHPLVVACVNPTGDLNFSAEVPSGAQVVLGGGGIPCSRASLSKALARPAGSPGLFYYAGHAVAEGLGGDSGDALVLSDGELLTAHLIFEAAATGSGPFFPSRVLLSACSSSGTAGSGAGEWLGLTAAMIWQGTRQVVATNWTLWDTAFTSAFEHRLASLLQSRHDAAGALREAQLEALNAWRQSKVAFLPHDIDDEGLSLAASEQFLTAPFPLVWAAYTCSGVLDPVQTDGIDWERLTAQFR